VKIHIGKYSSTFMRTFVLLIIRIHGTITFALSACLIFKITTRILFDASRES